MNIQFFKDFGFLTIVQTLKRLKGLLLLPLLTRFLNAGGFGLLEQLMITVTILGQFASLGQSTAVIRFFSGDSNGRAKQDVPMLCFLVMAVGAILWGVLAGSAPFVTKYLFHDADTQAFLKSIGILIIIIPLNALLYSYLRALRKTGTYAVVNGIDVVLEIACISGALLLGKGLSGVLLAFIVSKVLTLISLIATTIPRFQLQKPDFVRIKSYVQFGIPLILLPLLSKIINSGDRYVISYFLSTDAVGIYAVAYTLGSLIYTGSAPLYMTLYPVMSSLWNTGKLDELRKHIEFSMRYVVMVLVPASFGIVFLAHPIIQVLSGEQFVSGSRLVLFIIPGFVLYLVSLLGENILKIVKKTGLIFIFYVITASANVVMNIVLVPIIGMQGAAIGTFLSFGLIAFLMTSASYKYVRYAVDKKFIAKSVGASIIMTLFLLMWNPEGVFMVMSGIAIGGFIYFVVLWLMKGITEREKNLIMNRLPLRLSIGKNL